MVRLDVAVEIVRHKIVVSVLANRGNHGAEIVRGAKGAFFNLLEHLVEIRVDSVGTVGVRVAEVFDIFRQIAEEEDVAFADFASNFNLMLLGSETEYCERSGRFGRLTLAPSKVPMMRPPLRTNFMLLVPDAL